MEIQTRHDLFEPEDKTSLVCVDEAQVQRPVVDALGELGYRIHTGLFVEDISLKLRAHTYDVVAIYESFAGSVTEGNPVLLETIRTPPAQRRNQFVVLIGPNMITSDEIQAFQFSVDLVVSVRTWLISSRCYAGAWPCTRSSTGNSTSVCGWRERRRSRFPGTTSLRICSEGECWQAVLIEQIRPADVIVPSVTDINRLR